MSVLRWAAVPAVLAGALAGNVAFAAADEPPPAPTPTPTPIPIPPVTGTVINVVTTTITTTTVNAPIIVVAAPITTTINSTTTSSNTSTNSSSTNGGAAGREARQRLVMNLTGCRGSGRPSPAAQRGRAQVRLARNATLVVRVNGKPVTALRLPSTSRRHRRGVALRLRLSRDGLLTIRRPSERLVTVQGCTPS